MWLKVDPRLNTPMYLQIVNGIKEQIARGIWQPGQRLLTVRELAADISVNYNTVAKAYQELERENVIELIQGRGTYVSVLTEIPNAIVRKGELREAIKKWFVEAHYLQLSKQDVFELFNEVLCEWCKSEEANRNEFGG